MTTFQTLSHDMLHLSVFTTKTFGLLIPRWPKPGPAVAISQMQALLAYPGFLGDLGQIACPTSIICGQEDQRAPFAVHQELATSIRNASLNVIKLSGHFTPIEKPVEVTDCLKSWLKLDAK